MASEDIDLDSDSDCDSGSEYSVTQTQLGVSDGPIENEDVTNPLVSRMGGQVAWLPSKTLPPASVSQCKHCLQQMELLVQIFAPLDESPYDRLLLVWGCARSPCQKRGKGSIRALRVLTYNARWAARIEKRKRKQELREMRLKQLEEAKAARELEEAVRRKSNPFSSGKGTGTAGLFAPSEKTSVDANHADTVQDPQHSQSLDEEDGDEPEDEMDDLAEEMAVKAALASNKSKEPDWSKEAPAYYPPLYLNTYAEPSSSARAYEDSKEAKKQLEKLKQSGAPNTMKGWEAEQYESMMAAGVDEIFERFSKRVSSNGKQVVRYEFAGVPLAFHAKGATYEKLWPKKKSSTVTIGARNEKVLAREYSSKGISACPLCGAGRVFELQLMPNLVNTLLPGLIKGGEQGFPEEAPKDAEERRKREIEEVLGQKLPNKPDSDGITRSKTPSVMSSVNDGRLAARTGLRWSTAMIFVCEKDCRGKSEEQGDFWSEEEVEIQFEYEG